MLDFVFLGANIHDAEWEEPACEPDRMSERCGLQISIEPVVVRRSAEWLPENLAQAEVVPEAGQKVFKKCSACHMIGERENRGSGLC